MEFVTYREIPYEPFEFWDELRNQTSVRNIVVTSSRLRALNPRILADFDENADKVLMEHDETEFRLENVSDNEENAAALNDDDKEDSPVNSNRRKNSSNYNFNSDSEIQSQEDDSFEDSDFSLNTSSLISSDSDSSIDWLRKRRVKRTRKLTNDIDSSSDTSDLLDEEFRGKKRQESYLDTSSISSDMSDLSVAGISDSDDDLF